ncbi:unnamed protein product [Danaus chrysippus]|uniref:(African queen) hypothetical protein n=1 Tax=Danaus chrysippus TaxID=151541 RepID=A0A8J2QNY3_9NEOP|nr:unnamed protein product [Danaus chrysippus]
MSAATFISLFCVFIKYIIGTKASNHWMVTESGLIQPRIDSPFNLARPYDLLAFLNQEKRWDTVFEIYNDLSSRQSIIDTLWADVEKDTNMGVKIARNEHCVKAGNVNVIDWYAALLEDGSKKIPGKEFLLPIPYYGPNTDMPDCKRISSLAFSMFAFEHLEGMLQRDNLTVNPEFVLPELISPVMTLDQFGHWLTTMLQRNNSSWLYYHMASLYWRIRGNAPKAIECSRRALHFVPRVYKDIALGSLGMILHRSSKTNDAIVVLKAAIDHDPNNYVSHFAIANAYTVIGDFNTSIKYYDKTLRLNPRMELAAKHKFGALCHAKLGLRINSIRQTFNKLRQELKEYTKKETKYLKVQAEFLGTVRHPDDYEYRNVDKTFERMAEITGLKMKDMKMKIDKNSLIKYFLDGLIYNDDKLARAGIDGIDTIYSLERLVMHINTNSNGQNEPFHDQPSFSINIKEKVKPSEQKTAKPVSRDNKKEYHLVIEKKPTADEELSEFETGIIMYPPTITINRNIEDFDKEMEWPSNKLCKESAHKFPENVEAIFPVFLPFENKGIRPQFTYEVVDTGFLRQKLLEYVSDERSEDAAHMQDAEIGHRIYIAMKKKLAPRWLVLTLSSLYWRVRGQPWSALSCLRAAMKVVKPRYKDLVLVSLASVQLEIGLADEAMNNAEEAFRMSFYEPATNFLIAELSMLRKHRNTHMFHLKQVVRVEPGFMGGLARELLLAWACILKQVVALREMDYMKGAICTQVQPLMDLVCQEDEIHCKSPNIQCYTNHDTSSLVRMMDESDTDSFFAISENFFDPLIENTPADRGERLAHHANFDSMITTIESIYSGCGNKKCACEFWCYKNLGQEETGVKEEDCNYQHLQIGHWLHIVSFRQLLADSKLELPTEISSIQVNSKKIPECRLPDELDDFYLEKIARADTEGWKPVMTLMHQFSEMFDSYDFNTLGSKIAKYVEMRPRWWAGLVAAGWWCGAGGRGQCAARCLAAAHRYAPHKYATYPLRSLAAMLHMQSKQQDAKQIAYLSFYMSPKNKIEAFLLAVSHAYLAEYEQAMWMYRYALTFDADFVPAKASIHSTICLLLYRDGKAQFME